MSWPPLPLCAEPACRHRGGRADGLAATAPEAVKTRLDRIYDDAWQRWLREDPDAGHQHSRPRYNDRWPICRPQPSRRTRRRSGRARGARRHRYRNAHRAGSTNYDIVNSS